MYRFILAGLTGLSVFTNTQAYAQANANAVTGATDAFGFRNGDESIGIYDETSVRGFSLESAGNYRLNDTYFVRNSGVSNFFLENTTVRVGYNTLATSFPGPSGVVDYKLRDPKRGEPSAVNFGIDVYGQPYAELHLKHRSADDRASYSLGFSRVFDGRDMQGGRSGNSLLVAGVGRLTLGTVVLRGFFGEYEYERAGQFRVVPDADRLRPLIERRKFLGQSWAREKGQRRIAGTLIDAGLSKSAGIGATLVFSQEDPTRAFTQLFAGFADDGTAHARVIAIPQQRSTAWSGEFRGHVDSSFGDLKQRVAFAVRGRVQRSRYGGSQIIDLGSVPFGERLADIAAPQLDNAHATLGDQVDQWGIGLTYRAALRDLLRINLGLLRTDYRRTFTGSDGVSQRSQTTPLLYNAGLAWQVSKAFELYGSYSHGLEEAGVAPATVNRNQVLNAVEVTQRELGIRFTSGAGMSLVVAAFDTRKPYPGVDGVTNVYRFLGSVRHRGVESSLSARPARGMTIVVGGVLLDPSVMGQEVNARRIGPRPVGVPKVRAIANVDYVLPPMPGLSVDGGLVFIGDRAARSSLADAQGRQLMVPAITTLNLGLRYGFRIAGTKLTLRAQALNVLGQNSWDVNVSETLIYSAPRRYRLVLTSLF